MIVTKLVCRTASVMFTISIKMARGIIHANKPSPSFVCNENVFYDLQCKSCSSMKDDIQVLVNEMKSMTEIISILKEELKHHDSASHVQVNRLQILYIAVSAPNWKLS
jgi:hypothetical protein